MQNMQQSVLSLQFDKIFYFKFTVHIVNNNIIFVEFFNDAFTLLS